MSQVTQGNKWYGKLRATIRYWETFALTYSNANWEDDNGVHDRDRIVLRNLPRFSHNFHFEQQSGKEDQERRELRAHLHPTVVRVEKRFNVCERAKRKKGDKDADSELRRRVLHDKHHDARQKHLTNTLQDLEVPMLGAVLVIQEMNVLEMQIFVAFVDGGLFIQFSVVFVFHRESWVF